MPQYERSGSGPVQKEESGGWFDSLFGSSSPDGAASTPTAMDFSSEEAPVEEEEEEVGTGRRSSRATPSRGGGDDGGDDAPTALQTAAEDLGSIAAMDGNFYKTAGSLVDALVPSPGNKGKIDLTIEVPVDAAGLVKARFTFGANVSRTAKGVTAKFEVGGEVEVSKEMGLGIATIKAFAKAGINGFIEAAGDDGTACFRLMGLAIRERLAGASESIADAIFDKAYIDETIEMMDEDDYVETGLSASASAGVSASASGGAGSLGGKGDAAAEATTKTRLTKGADGGLKSDVTNEASAKASASVTATLKGKVKDFDVKGSLSLEGSTSTDAGSKAKLKLSAEGSTKMSGKEMSELVLGGAYLTDALAGMGGLISAARANLGSGDGGRMAGAMGDFLMGSSGAGVAIDQASVEAAEALKSMDVKVGFKLSATGEINHKLQPKFKMELQRSDEIKVGGGLKVSLVEVVVENVQSLFVLALP